MNNNWVAIFVGNCSKLSVALKNVAFLIFHIRNGFFSESIREAFHNNYIYLGFYFCLLCLFLFISLCWSQNPDSSTMFRKENNEYGMVFFYVLHKSHIEYFIYKWPKQVQWSEQNMVIMILNTKSMFTKFHITVIKRWCFRFKYIQRQYNQMNYRTDFVATWIRKTLTYKYSHLFIPFQFK